MHTNTNIHTHLHTHTYTDTNKGSEFFISVPFELKENANPSSDDGSGLSGDSAGMCVCLCVASMCVFVCSDACDVHDLHLIADIHVHI
jgi:hypothetical protein